MKIGEIWKLKNQHPEWNGQDWSKTVHRFPRTAKITELNSPNKAEVLVLNLEDNVTTWGFSREEFLESYQKNYGVCHD